MGLDASAEAFPKCWRSVLTEIAPNSWNGTSTGFLVLVTVIKVAVVLFILLTAIAYLTWLERKLVAHIQSRWGPYLVGPSGLLQPLADGLKFLFKEDIVPREADRFIYWLAPFLAFTLAFFALAAAPFGTCFTVG